MQKFHDAARGALDVEKFDDALAVLQSADETTNAWPEETLPLNLYQLKATGETLRAEVEKRRKLRADFDRLSGQIRANVLDPDMRVQGMELYKQVSADQRRSAVRGVTRGHLRRASQLRAGAPPRRATARPWLPR